MPCLPSAPNVVWFRRAYLTVAAFFISTYLLSLLVAVWAMYFTREGLEFISGNHWTTYSVPEWMMLKFGPVTIFLFTSMVFALCFVSSAISRPNLYDSYRVFPYENTPSLPKNFLATMPFLCSATFALFYSIHWVEETLGVPVGGVEFTNVFEGLFNTSFSAMIEELIFRLFPVLLPVAVYMILWYKGENQSGWLGLRHMMLALFKPKKFQEMFAMQGNQGLRRLEALLVMASSIIFASAHVASGSWGPGKLLTAFIAGVVLGFSALRYGFESSILLHWFYNAYWPSIAIASENIPALADFFPAVFYLTVLSGAAFLFIAPFFFWIGRKS